MKTKYNSILFLIALLFTGSLLSQVITLQPFATGLDSPVDIQNAGDDRLFVVEQDGQIVILENGNQLPTPFLNISGQTNGSGERGLLGLAFHPNYADNGYFYVNYTMNNGDTQISRFTVSADPNVADPGSELEIIDYDQPYSNHNGGYLRFGPDGYLWIGTGDGGSAEDPENRAQNLNTLLGKMLRIDVDNPSNGNNYGIPADNPYLGNTSGLDEIYAYGLRNPWKYDFDTVTGDLWIADVGQYEIEEINRVSSTVSNINYGWRCYEGSQPFNTNGCPAPSTLTDPVAEYNHSGGNCSITGGYVYRGPYQDLQGFYFYADVCSGEIGYVDQDNNLVNLGDFNGTWTTFGLDIEGHLYIGNLATGQISRINGNILGTSEFGVNNALHMFPNPASEQFTIKTNQTILSNIEVVDIKGARVLTQENLQSNEVTVNIENLKSGFYIVKATTNFGNVITRKLVIQ